MTLDESETIAGICSTVRVINLKVWFSNCKCYAVPNLDKRCPPADLTVSLLSTSSHLFHRFMKWFTGAFPANQMVIELLYELQYCFGVDGTLCNSPSWNTMILETSWRLSTGSIIYVVVPRPQGCLAWTFKRNLIIIIILFFHLERACRIFPWLWLRTLLARLRDKKRSVFIGTTSSKFVLCICCIIVAKDSNKWSIFSALRRWGTASMTSLDTFSNLMLWFGFTTRRKSSFTW